MADDTKTAESTEDSDDLTGDLSSSVGPDGIDPELVKLSRPARMRFGPVLSISVLVFCAYIMYQVYPDLRFSRASETPQAYESVAALLSDGDAEQLVRVEAVPDRSFAVHVAHSQADEGSRLAPVQGSDGKLWLMLSGTVWSTDIRYREVYTGRLRRAADLPFFDQLQDHARDRGPGPRFVSATSARGALESGAQVLRDPAGDSIEVAADTPVQIYETLADKARIHLFPTERLPLEKDLTAELVQAGLIPAGFKPQRSLADSWIYIVDIEGGADAARERLRAQRVLSAGCDPIKQLHETTWGQLTSKGQLLAVGDKNLVTWSNVTWVAVDVPRTVPADAMVILTQEQPGAYWYVPILFAILGLSALFFGFALFRSLRPLGRT